MGDEHCARTYFRIGVLEGAGESHEPVVSGEVRAGAVIEGRLPLVYHRRAFIDLAETGD